MFSIKRFVILSLIVVFLGVSFFFGFLYGQQKSSAPAAPPQVKVEVQLPGLEGVDFRLLTEVWDLIQKNYLKKPVPEKKLFYGALAGSVASLEDPYSVFLEPKTAEKFTQELSGSFEGIGAEIGIRNDNLVIIAPLLDTPAEKAGLRAGDRILVIEKSDTAGMPLDQAVNLIRGPKGTEVKLLINRNGFAKPKEFVIVRDTIKIRSVKWEMKDKKIAYIKLSYFNEDTTNDFNQVVREILLQNPRAVILDLRNNPGGFLNVAVEVAGEWIEKKTAVIERFSDQRQEEFKTEGLARLQNIKTIILVNPGSASGAEIVAGALQDYGKAILVGEKTFGKGSIQDLKQLRDGSAVKLTVGEWLTPKGRQINEKGIAPDIEIKLTEEDYSADRDPQLDRALEILK